MSIGQFLLGVGAIIVGVILTIAGVGGPLGARLIAFGALTIFQTAFSNKSGRGGLAGSGRWAWDNLQNVGTEGGPIPVPYGEDRFAPPVISVVPLQEGADAVVYAQYLVGHGPITEIADVEVNGIPIANFKGAEWIAKLGTSTQTAEWSKTRVASSGNFIINYPGFGLIGRTFQAGTQLGANATHVHVMQQEADALTLALVMPSGIYKQGTKGPESNHVEISIEYRLASSADSGYGPFAVPKDSTGKQRQGEWSAYGAAGTWILEKKVTATYRSTIRLDFPSRGLWAVRVTGRQDNTNGLVVIPTLATVSEIVNDARAYAGYAVLGVKLPPSEQLNSGLPLVTIRYRGRTVIDPRVSLTVPAYSANNALVALDFLTNATYGLGDRVSLSACDVGAITYNAAGFLVGGTWRAFADYCDQSVTPRGALAADVRHRFDFPIDTIAEAREWLGHMLGLARGALYQTDGLTRVAWDRPTTETPYVFEARKSNVSNRHNIIAAPGPEGSPGPGESTLVARILPENDRPTIVRVYFMDREDHNRRRSVDVQNRVIAIDSTTGTPTPGEELKVTRSGAAVVVGRYVFHAGGRLYYVVDDGAAEPSASETVTGKTSGATFAVSASAAAAWPTPVVLQEMNAAGIVRRSAAIALARWQLNRALLTPTFASLKTFAGDVHLEPADAANVSDDDQGWTARAFKVESVSRDGTAIGEVVLREYHAGVYVDSIDQVPGLGRFINPAGSVPPGLRDSAESAKPTKTNSSTVNAVAAATVKTTSSGAYASWYDGNLRR